jgi:hypothetical protein
MRRTLMLLSTMVMLALLLAGGLALVALMLPTAVAANAYLDTDGDGFFDPVPSEQVDSCPDEAGVAPDGCPPPAPEYGHYFFGGNECEGVNVDASNFPTAMTRGPANTTYCLQDGTYTLSGGNGLVPPEGARIIGEYADDSAPVIDAGSALNGIHAGTRSSLYLEDLEVLGAEYIEEGCSPEANCGRGVYPADETHFVNVWLHDNENNGIGGGGGHTLLVERSTIGPNNGNADSGRDDPANDPVSAAGAKVTQGTVLTVRNSLVVNNYWDGLWCDVQCGGLNVYDSKISGQYRGIHYEISYGPGEITRNEIIQNGLNSPINPQNPAGMLVQNSQDVHIFDNDFGSNDDYAAQFANSASRTPQMARVALHDNRLGGDTLKNCPMQGVTCTGNTP